MRSRHRWIGCARNCRPTTSVSGAGIPFVAGDEVRFEAVAEEEARKARGKEAVDFA